MKSSFQQKKYRFGFVLTTAAGNMTRYLNLRKYAECDTEVECVWAPVKHYLEPDPFRHLPGPLRTRAIVLREAALVMEQLGRLDAVMFHAFEPYVAAVLRSRLSSSPLIVWSQDNPPLSSRHQNSHAHVRASWRRDLRYKFDIWCAKQAALLFPFSPWAAHVLTDDCGLSAEKVHPIHVGLDLELWPYQPKSVASAGLRPQILFVGGNFVRKGGDLLLDVYQRKFADRADLHLVTKEPPPSLPSGVSVYTDFGPNEARLKNLYAKADLFVLPTRDDMSSWVAMEAMATGRPVIATRMGGIPDIVRDGSTGFLIAPNDEGALIHTMTTLLDDADLRCQMGAGGRAVIENDFNASVSVPRIFAVMKQAVDAARHNNRKRRPAL